MKLLAFITFLFLLVNPANAQVQLSQQVIGPAGSFGTTGNTIISSTTGETVITTNSNSSNHLTQGFQQPRTSNTALTATVAGFMTSCNISKDGYAVAQVSGGAAPYNFLWSTGATDDTVRALSPGVYWVTISSSNGLTKTDSVIIKANAEMDCKLKIYSGISPNGDNHNDTWEIDGIEYFPENEVSIFNRWGDPVWEKKNYNNDDVIWTGTNQSGKALPDGTYFYIVKTSAVTEKGWVEITR